MFGKKLKQSTIQKLRAVNTGAHNPSAGTYEYTFEGKQTVIEDLAGFCLQRGFPHSSIRTAVRKNRPYRGVHYFKRITHAGSQ